MHHRELSRLWRGYPHLAPDKRTCRSSGVCEEDSTSKLSESHWKKLREYDARWCILFTEGYRSGHNEAVLKTVCPKGTWVRIPHPPPEKAHICLPKNVCFFQRNPPSLEKIHLRWMKSLCDEIPLRGDRRGGFHFI